MDYCTPHFGKPLHELALDDLNAFFATEKIETDQLELKSFGGLSNDHYRALNRTASAFLNSKGGLLIWGAPIGISASGKKEKVFQGPLTPINPILTKDQLISKLSDSIIPLPTGIRVNIVEDRNQGCICIFEVDESNYAPHQFDKTYYMRIDGQTKPAPHHYVEALFKKIRYPEIEGYLKFTKVVDNGSSFYIHFEVYLINFSSLQNAEDISFRVIFDKAKFPTSATNRGYAMNGHEWRQDSYKAVLHNGQPIRDTNYIEVSKDDVGPNDVLYGMLSFGARNSPAKSSEYRINLGHLKIGVSPEKAISERVENQLFADIQARKGATKEHVLRTLLGR